MHIVSLLLVFFLLKTHCFLLLYADCQPQYWIQFQILSILHHQCHLPLACHHHDVLNNHYHHLCWIRLQLNCWVQAQHMVNSFTDIIVHSTQQYCRKGGCNEGSRGAGPILSLWTLYDSYNIYCIIFFFIFHIPYCIKICSVINTMHMSSKVCVCFVSSVTLYINNDRSAS